MGKTDGSPSGLTAEQYQKYKLPYVKTEFAVLRNERLVSLGPNVNEPGARAYAQQQELELYWRSVSDWLPIKDKN